MVYANYPKLMENPPLVGVIGGSGLYKLDNFTIQQTIDVDTPWGKPSSPLTIATLSRPDQPGQDVSVAFIARHSPDHSITPSHVPARANIAALKHLGVQAIVAFSAVGSLREEVRPGDLVVPDQIIDRTKGIRPSTFFDSSLVGHAMFGEPFSITLSEFLLPHIQTALDSFSSNVQDGDSKPRLHSEKTLIVMEGPQFSTRAESNVYRMWGGDIINMSTIPEAKLAREAELNYALVCTSTDYDAWRVGHAPVTVEEVMKTLSNNASLSKHITAEILAKVHDALSKGEIESAKGGMKWSLMTRHEFVKQQDLDKYRYILPEYFGGEENGRTE